MPKFTVKAKRADGKTQTFHLKAANKEQAERAAKKIAKSNPKPGQTGTVKI